MSFESAITLALRQELGDSGRIAERFIPYIQMHEFEALLFANPAVLATAINRPDLTNTFTDIVTRCNGCETIDNSPSTAPSKRIIGVHPSYAKVSMGSVAAQKIGLGTMRKACPHFNEWVGRLEKLAP